jgi:hypothetical protein
MTGVRAYQPRLSDGEAVAEAGHPVISQARQPSVGMLVSTPVRMPVGQREVMVLMRV